MGHISKKKLILVSCFLIVTGFIVNGKTDPPVAEKKTSLNEVLKNLDGWQTKGRDDLDSTIVKSLELDDYANHYFTDGVDSLFLFIGYYLQGKKIGAAHDPLVCFPGQGWVVTKRSKGQIVVDPKNGDKISYSLMVVERNESKHLVIYWFQAHDKTYYGTFSQKLGSFWNTVLNKETDSAFVRVSTSLEGKNEEEGKRDILRFINSFYPVLLDYIKNY